MNKKLRQSLRWLVSDKDGTVVFGERPNLPILAGIAAMLMALIIPGFGQVVFGFAAYGALFTWAWLELFDGTTPLRRILGGSALVGFMALATILLTLLAARA